MILVYTFRTNPFRKKLKEHFPDLFVFGSLKKDIQSFSTKIVQEKPEYILGIANEDSSRFETITVNKFSKEKKIDRKGDNLFELYTDKRMPFPLSKNPTYTFCNWTMYKLTQLIQENKLNARLMFTHLKQEDLPKLVSFTDLVEKGA